MPVRREVGNVIEKTKLQWAHFALDPCEEGPGREQKGREPAQWPCNISERHQLADDVRAQEEGLLEFLHRL